jgi:hypothetical protein
MMNETNDEAMMRFAVADLTDETGTLRRRGAGRGALKIVTFEADEIGKQISSVLSKVSKQIQTASTALVPNRLTIGVSATVRGDVGIIFVAKGSAQATLEITAEWDFKP